jgi:hypothetical protein
MKKPKCVVKNTVPATLYPNSKDDGKDPAIDKVEITVAQASELIGKEDELEVPMMDVSTVYSHIKKGSQRLGENSAGRYSTALQSSCDLFALFLDLLVCPANPPRRWHFIQQQHHHQIVTKDFDQPMYGLLTLIALGFWSMRRGR